MRKHAGAAVFLLGAAILSTACGDEVAAPDEMEAHFSVDVFHGRSEAFVFAQLRTYELELPPTETLDVRVNDVVLEPYPDRESEHPTARFHSEGVPLLEGAGAYTFVVRGEGREPLTVQVPRVTPAAITSPPNGVEASLDAPLTLTWTAAADRTVFEGDAVSFRVLGLHEPTAEAPPVEDGATSTTLSPKILRAWYEAALHTAKLVARDEGTEPALRDGEPIPVDVLLTRFRLGRTSPTFASGGYTTSQQLAAVSVTLVP